MVMVAGCATTTPAWRARAQQEMRQLAAEPVPTLWPDAFRSMRETFEHGEAIYRVEDNAELADQNYRLALQQGELLRDQLRRYRAQQAEKARLQAEEERQRGELEEQRQQAADAKRRREMMTRERTLSHGGRSAQNEAAGSAVRERPASYSVRRGETLPQIAARPEIYNEAGLWPLIYRANRDQVRDPYQLWPGQVLKIPRTYTREEAVEARRQAGHRP